MESFIYLPSRMEGKKKIDIDIDTRIKRRATVYNAVKMTFVTIRKIDEGK